MKASQNPPWTKWETILALDLYLKRRPQLPSKLDDDIVRLSGILRKYGERKGISVRDNFRNPAGVAMKLGNLRRLDTSLGLIGLGNGAKLEEEVWSEYANAPEELSRAVTEALAKLTN